MQKLTNSSKMRRLFVCMAVGLFVSACEPKLPDDLSALIRLMNENSQTTSVDATNKVWRVYGKSGLLQALRDGQATARGLAAYRLKEFRDAETEQVLLEVVVKESVPFVRAQALTSLQDVGTERAIHTLEIAAKDSDPDVARNAKDAIEAIRVRSTTPRH
jgi:HEAT repeat protein